MPWVKKWMVRADCDGCGITFEHEFLPLYDSAAEGELELTESGWTIDGPVLKCGNCADGGEDGLHADREREGSTAPVKAGDV